MNALGGRAAADAAQEREVLCVLSEELLEQYQGDLEGLCVPGIRVRFQGDAEDALAEIAQKRPFMVIVGMETDFMEGLEFVARLMSQERGFDRRIVVLPDKGDPFPPTMQYLDPDTGRSITDQTDMMGIAAFLEESQETIAESRAAPAVAEPPAAPAAPAVAESPVATPDLAGLVLEPVAETREAPEAAPLGPPPSPSSQVLSSWVPPTPTSAPPSAPELAAPPVAGPSAGTFYGLIPEQQKRAVLIAGAALLAIVLLFLVVSRLGGDETPAATPEKAPETAPGTPERGGDESAGGDTAPQGSTSTDTERLNKATNPTAESQRQAADDLATFAVHVTLPLRYARGSVDFEVADEDALDAIVASARRALEAHKDMRLEVGGHTSAESKANLKLGRRRAERMMDALIERGLPADRLVVKTYGTKMPARDHGPGELEECRRVTLRVIQ